MVHLHDARRHSSPTASCMARVWTPFGRSCIRFCSDAGSILVLNLHHFDNIVRHAAFSPKHTMYYTLTTFWPPRLGRKSIICGRHFHSLFGNLFKANFGIPGRHRWHPGRCSVFLRPPHGSQAWSMCARRNQKLVDVVYRHRKNGW